MMLPGLLSADFETYGRASISEGSIGQFVGVYFRGRHRRRVSMIDTPSETAAIS